MSQDQDLRFCPRGASRPRPESRGLHHWIFDNELNFVQHCKEKINTAYSYLGIIKRNFIYLDEDAFVMLYKSQIRAW